MMIVWDISSSQIQAVSQAVRQSVSQAVCQSVLPERRQGLDDELLQSPSSTSETKKRRGSGSGSCCYGGDNESGVMVMDCDGGTLLIEGIDARVVVLYQNGGFPHSCHFRDCCVLFCFPHAGIFHSTSC